MPSCLPFGIVGKQHFSFNQVLNSKSFKVAIFSKRAIIQAFQFKIAYSFHLFKNENIDGNNF
jgi:hypothetical protein